MRLPQRLQQRLDEAIEAGPAGYSSSCAGTNTATAATAGIICCNNWIKNAARNTPIPTITLQRPQLDSWWRLFPGWKGLNSPLQFNEPSCAAQGGAVTIIAGIHGRLNQGQTSEYRRSPVQEVMRLLVKLPDKIASRSGPDWRKY